MLVLNFKSIGLLSLVLFYSCTELTELEEPKVVGFSGVDSQLWNYYQTFENEAAIRGINVDLHATNISAEILNIPEDGVAGTCQFGSHIQNHITIDSEFWNRSSTLGRELVVFHELGHCYLNRGHSESTDIHGFCLSIMASGTGDCEPAYNQVTREDYLDELFFTD